MPDTNTFGGFPFDAEVFTNYIAERDPVNSLLVTSGIVTALDPSIATLLNEKGFKVTIPFYNVFDGDPLNYDGATDNVPVTLEGNQMSATGYRRMKAWTEGDFTHELTGSDGLANCASHIGEYDAKCNQKTMISILKALEGVTGFEDHVNNLHVPGLIDISDANRLTPETVVNGMQSALGDHYSEFKVWFMRSEVFTSLVLQNLQNNINTMANTNTQDPFAGYFLGKPVIVDDSLPVTKSETVATYYTSYLLGTGAFVTAPVRIDTPNYVAYDAKANGGATTLYHKWGRLLHPYGFSIASENFVKYSPTDTELGTSANWSMKYMSKNIPIAIFNTNL